MVWQTLIDSERMPDWCGGLYRVEIENREPITKGARLRCYTSPYGYDIFYNVTIVNFIPETQISFQNIGAPQKPLLLNQKLDFELKPLLDGTTEVTLKDTYTTGTFFTKIFNQLYLREDLLDQNKRRLTRLKQVIEKV